MILGDRFIRWMMRRKRIVGARDSNVQHGSLDMRLGNSFLSMKPNQYIVLGVDAVEYEKITDNNGVWLNPGEFILGTTIESLKLPKWIAADFDNRSSLARVGIGMEIGWYVDPGHKGEITLEIFNYGTAAVFLPVGQRVGQCVFHTVFGASHVYEGKYVGQRGATGSMVQYDAENIWKYATNQNDK